jgi:hypothetical protein
MAAKGMKVKSAVEHIHSMVKGGRSYEACFDRVCAVLQLNKDERDLVRKQLEEESILTTNTETGYEKSLMKGRN